MWEPLLQCTNVLSMGPATSPRSETRFRLRHSAIHYRRTTLPIPIFTSCATLTLPCSLPDFFSLYCGDRTPR